MDAFYLTLGLVLLGDIVIWLGFYYLSAKAHIRRCRKDGDDPNLCLLRIEIITGFLLFHAFLIWMGIELVKWGGPD